MLAALPADLVAAVLSFGDPSDLYSALLLSTHAALRQDALWKGLCHRLWRGKENFEGHAHPLVGVFRVEGGALDRVTRKPVPLIYKEAWPSFLRQCQRRLSWRESYRYSLEDATRTRLFVHELETLPWLRTDASGIAVCEARRRIVGAWRLGASDEPLHPRSEDEFRALLAEGSGFIQFCAEQHPAVVALLFHGKFIDARMTFEERRYWEVNGNEIVAFGNHASLSISRREDWGWRLEDGYPSGNADYTLVESCSDSIKQTQAWREHTPWLDASGAFTPQVARFLKYSDDFRDMPDESFGKMPDALPAEPYPGLKKETSDALTTLARLLAADHPGHTSAFEAFAKDLVADPDRASA